MLEHHHDSARRAAMLQWLAEELRDRAGAASDTTALGLARDLERLAASLLVGVRTVR